MTENIRLLLAAPPRFLSRKSVTPRELWALGYTLSPPRMRRALFISLVACLVTIHQARLIDRCDLAKLLQQEDMDGFEGYSLSDCECHFLTTLISSSPGHALHDHLSFSLCLKQVKNPALSKKPFPASYILSVIILQHLKTSMLFNWSVLPSAQQLIYTLYEIFC